MVSGEIMNFIGKPFHVVFLRVDNLKTRKIRLGYTFAPAILITPLGALSVIIG